MPSSTTKNPQDHKPPRKKASRPPRASSQPVPNPEPTDSKYAPTAWGSGGIGSTEDITVPSGQLCLVTRPGVQGLMKAGVLHQADSLSSLVQEKHLSKDKPGGIDVESLSQDEKAIENLIHVVDRVVCHVVVKPEIHMTPNDITRRKSGVVYADMVDLTDKMFLFNYAMGGTRDLESFREELTELVGSVDDVEDVPEAPE